MLVRNKLLISQPSNGPTNTYYSMAATQRPTTLFSFSWYLARKKLRKDGKCPVYLKFRVRETKSAMRCGCCVLPSNWMADVARLSSMDPDSPQVNEQLRSLEASVYNHFNYLVATQIEFDAKTLRNSILGISQDKSVTGFLELFDLYLKERAKVVGLDITHTTHIRSIRVRRYFEEFLKVELRKNDIKPKDIDYVVLKNFYQFLRVSRNQSNNTAIKLMHLVRAVFKDLIRQGVLQADPFVNVKLSLEERARMYLTDDELTRLIHKSMPNERLQKVKDAFLFSCYTGLSYSDVQKLKWSEIENSGKMTWVKTTRLKTGTSSIIPLLPPAFQIIMNNKSGCVIEDDRVFAIASNQKVNAYLKEIGTLSNISKPLTFHMARHTFATTVTLMNDVPIESVSRMLGHKKLVTTQHYARIVDKKLESDMSKLALRYNHE